MLIIVSDIIVYNFSCVYLANRSKLKTAQRLLERVNCLVLCNFQIYMSFYNNDHELLNFFY